MPLTDTVDIMLDMVNELVGPNLLRLLDKDTESKPAMAPCPSTSRKVLFQSIVHLLRRLEVEMLPLVSPSTPWMKEHS